MCSLTSFIRDVNASFGRPNPIAAISATTYVRNMHNQITSISNKIIK